MGSRANAIVVENGRVRVYFDKWAAEHIGALVFWGLERTLEEFGEWMGGEEEDPSWNGEDMLDDIWAEGGCCVDLDRRYLLVYGYDPSDVIWIEAYLKLMRYTWPGWTIEWSWGKNAQIAKYLGVTGTNLREIDDACFFVPSEDHLDWCMEHLLDVPGYEMADAITVSAQRDGRTCASFVYEEDPEWLLLIGDRLEGVVSRLGNEKLAYDGRRFPQGGLHLDYDRREIWVWRDSRTQIEIVPSACWDGWDVHDCRHDYRVFYSAVPRFIDFVPRREMEYVRRIGDWVCRDVTCPRKMRQVDRKALFNRILEEYRTENPTPVMVPDL